MFLYFFGVWSTLDLSLHLQHKGNHLLKRVGLWGVREWYFPDMQLAFILKTSLHDLGSHSIYLDPNLFHQGPWCLTGNTQRH